MSEFTLLRLIGIIGCLIWTAIVSYLTGTNFTVVGIAISCVLIGYEWAVLETRKHGPEG